MRTIAYALVAALVLAGVPTISGHADDTKTLKALMIKKLENSQKVLEGLALGDFEKIAKHAEELILISKAVEFRVHKTPQYELHSNDFRRNAENLVQQAKAKNMDGAALTYLEMTLSCVKCHKHMREIRMTRLED
jgi:hypothetical protein